ncbi:MAG TPA: hypothetical protein VK914_11780 [bacterium]|jgi:hypothetical protein|nr:hypothetical protein [bacterium]
MTRAWLLILCLFGAGAARADAPPADENAAWRTVTLFDWLYSGEPAYQTLKQAATAAGDQGWVAQRLDQNQKVPQASARELAQKLEDNQTLDPALVSQLKTLFADETQQMGQSAQDAVAKQADQLDANLAKDSAKLDALEASEAVNTYGKGSSTGVTLNLYTGYRVDDPSASYLHGQEYTYGMGGMQTAMIGSIGKVNYNFTLGMEYYYNNLNQGSPGGAPGLSETLAVDPRTYNGNVDAGLTLQFPLGNEGGLDVSIGAVQNVELSPLLFASIEPVNRDAFFVDVTAPYRAPKVIKTMEMNYPAETYNFRGLYVVKGGSVWYWPFDNTQFIYTPNDQTYYATWDAKLETWSLRVDEDLRARDDWFDGGNYYGMVEGSGNDEEQLLADGTTGGLSTAQSTQSFGLGSQLRFSSGAIVHLDAAASSYHWDWPNTACNCSQDYSGTAAIATVVQPVGPFNFALQAGQASPDFLSSPRVENRIQIGATQDSIAQPYSVNGVDLASIGENNPAKPQQLSWLSMMNEPDVLTNNTNQLVLRGEWHGSWISAGAYDGAQMQINPTDAYVWTTPYIEGNENDGYGWFRIFGNTFANGPSVLPFASPGGQATGTADLINFNRPTDGHANTPTLANMPVHWQQMAQYGNYETEFITLLSQKGVGDSNVLADSAKSLNYAGANLLFDFGALLNLDLPLQLTVIGEDRDMNTSLGLPGGGGDDLFNQQFEVADLNWGVSQTVTLLGTAGCENWKSVQSYYPVNMQITEFGAGADLNEDPLVTGLVFNFRASVMTFEDLNIGSRDLSLITLSLGSTLSY